MSDWTGDELFASLKGATLKSIEGMKDGSEEVAFVCEDGRRFRMYHERDCCESVALYDVAGDAEDLIGSPLLMAGEQLRVLAERGTDLTATATFGAVAGGAA